MKALKLNGYADYIPGYLDTGYFLNKFMPHNSDIYSGGGDVILNYAQNSYAIRMADTYLMEAEALGASVDKLYWMLFVVVPDYLQSQLLCKPLKTNAREKNWQVKVIDGLI